MWSPSVPPLTFPSAPPPSPAALGSGTGSPAPRPDHPPGPAASSWGHKHSDRGWACPPSSASSSFSFPSSPSSFSSSYSSSQVSSVSTSPSPTRVSFPLIFGIAEVNGSKPPCCFAAKALFLPGHHRAHHCMGIKPPSPFCNPFGHLARCTEGGHRSMLVPSAPPSHHCASRGKQEKCNTGKVVQEREIWKNGEGAGNTAWL